MAFVNVLENATLLASNQRRILRYLVLLGSAVAILLLYNIQGEAKNAPVLLSRNNESSRKCSDMGMGLKTLGQKGPYLVLYNFVKGIRQFKCDETITLSAPADYTFLDNIPPLVGTWIGPISVALYAPGWDFFATLDSIAYLRNCEDPLIRELVTFHVFFDAAHVPVYTNISGENLPLTQAYSDTFDCKRSPPFSQPTQMYKNEKNLRFPINVARNIARETATTQFILPSDVELFPTPGFIDKFLEFSRRNRSLFVDGQRKVFVLPVFEVLKDQTIPRNKTRLQELIGVGRAQLFHKNICSLCHKVVDGDRWVEANETEGLGVFSVGKRAQKHVFWEPFYVCTHEEPVFDERLTWEGQSNKMAQAFTMCLMDYDFVILDNAFLTHKPGVKLKKVQNSLYKQDIDKTGYVLRNIRDELNSIFGRNKNCRIDWRLRPF